MQDRKRIFALRANCVPVVVRVFDFFAKKLCIRYFTLKKSRQLAQWAHAPYKYSALGANKTKRKDCALTPDLTDKQVLTTIV